MKGIKAGISGASAVGMGSLGMRNGRVLIVDDHQLFSESIRSVLEEEGIEVIGTEVDPENAFHEVMRTNPDLVLVDLRLPGGDGISLGRRILKQCAGTRVLMVSALDQVPVTSLVQEGFQGYLTKDVGLRDFVTCVQAALHGEVIVRRRPVSGNARHPSANGDNGQLFARHLTNREREVLALLVEGASGAQIAARLSVSPNTVRSHIQNILTKLQVRSRLEAAAFAVRHELVDVAASRSSA
jgi:DNA-binding NarL/FixJ family response regulator